MDPHEPPSPDMKAQIFLADYKNQLRAAEARDHLEEDVVDERPLPRNPVTAFFVRIARWLKKPA